MTHLPDLILFFLLGTSTENWNHWAGCTKTVVLGEGIAQGVSRDQADSRRAEQGILSNAEDVEEAACSLFHFMAVYPPTFITSWIPTSNAAHSGHFATYVPCGSDTWLT